MSQSQPTAPSWMTAELLSASLGEEVTSLASSAAAAPGTNYGSVVTRVTARLRNREDPLTLIVKSEVTEGAFKDNFALKNTVEHCFYYKFLPEAREIADTSFAPRTFPADRFETVMLEDLTPLGFKVADRREQLDWEHCRLYAIAAARLHAASAAVHKRRPDIIARLADEKLFAEDAMGAAIMKRMVDIGLKSFLDVTEGKPQFSRVHKIFTGVKDRLWRMIVEAVEKRDGLNTINQGDPWITNMMFRYDERGRVQEIRLLDFQMVKYGCPVYDLAFFIWTSANHQVKNSRLPELYRVYLENLNETLKESGCDGMLTEEDFAESMRRLSPLIAFNVGTSWPLILNRAPIDFAEMSKDDKFFERFYDEHFCSYHLPMAVEQMEKAGVLDYLETYLEKL